jgi:Family of unknown function (DUF6876)
METQTMNKTTQPQFKQADLQQFTGDTKRYRHPLNRRVIYTPGVQYVAEHGEAYWLIDAIASYYGDRMMTHAIAEDERLRTLQFWHLEVRDDGSAVLTMRADSGVKPAITQEIPFTDFSLGTADIWAGFDGMCWTLYLPSEH